MKQSYHQLIKPSSHKLLTSQLEPNQTTAHRLAVTHGCRHMITTILLWHCSLD